MRIFDPSVDVEIPDDDLEPIDEAPAPEECVELRPALVILDKTGDVEGIILDARMWDE